MNRSKLLKHTENETEYYGHQIAKFARVSATI